MPRIEEAVADILTDSAMFVLFDMLLPLSLPLNLRGFEPQRFWDRRFKRRYVYLCD